MMWYLIGQVTKQLMHKFNENCSYCYQIEINIVHLKLQFNYSFISSSRLFTEYVQLCIAFRFLPVLLSYMMNCIYIRPLVRHHVICIGGIEHYTQHGTLIEIRQYVLCQARRILLYRSI